MNPNIFYNSELVLIEYRDIIKHPDLLLLEAAVENTKLHEILDFEQVKYLNQEGLKEWYVNRTKRNIFMNLLPNNSEFTQKDIDILLEDQLQLSSNFFEFAPLLAMGTAVKALIKSGLAKKIVIYSESYNKHIESDIMTSYGHSCKYIHGDFGDIIADFPRDCTYILSDIDKVITLYEAKHLDYASIVLPMEYRYNKFDMQNFKVDFPELNKAAVFKYGFIRAFTPAVE